MVHSDASVSVPTEQTDVPAATIYDGVFSNDPELDAELRAVAQAREEERVAAKVVRPCLLYDDPREISMIFGEIGGWHRSEGHRIVAYKEHGQCDWVPYFAVYLGDEIVARVPGHLVAVAYHQEDSF